MRYAFSLLLLLLLGTAVLPGSAEAQLWGLFNKKKNGATVADGEKRQKHNRNNPDSKWYSKARRLISPWAPDYKRHKDPYNNYRNAKGQKVIISKGGKHIRRPFSWLRGTKHWDKKHWVRRAKKLERNRNQIFTGVEDDVDGADRADNDAVRHVYRDGKKGSSGKKQKSDKPKEDPLEQGFGNWDSWESGSGGGGDSSGENHGQDDGN